MLDFDIPEWMQEGAPSAAVPENPREMDFVGPDQEKDADEGENEGTEASDISREELKEYILSERPTFPDLPLDFPKLYERNMIKG